MIEVSSRRLPLVLPHRLFPEKPQVNRPHRVFGRNRHFSFNQRPFYAGIETSSHGAGPTLTVDPADHQSPRALLRSWFGWPTRIRTGGYRRIHGVLVTLEATLICGSDLHILKGHLPEVEAGRILGHEAIATVEQVGASVRNLKSATASSCRAFRPVEVPIRREARFGQCLDGGVWVLGHTIDGTQAERCASHLPTPRPIRSHPGRT